MYVAFGVAQVGGQTGYAFAVDEAVSNERTARRGPAYPTPESRASRQVGRLQARNRSHVRRCAGVNNCFCKQAVLGRTDGRCRSNE